MFINNHNLNELVIIQKKFIPNYIEKCKIFQIEPRKMKFYSQQNEDKYIIQYLLKKKITDGVFLELGACNGVLYSNTKTLEDYFGFSGILIEPQKEFYEKLKVNRPKCECYNYAISNSGEEYIEFIGNDPTAGILDNLNTDLTNKNWASYEVKNKKLKDILANSKFNYVDFMIIDVEGGELEVLKSIDFSFPIFCIIIEADSNNQKKNIEFGKILYKNNFRYIVRQRGNEVWINKDYFRKHLFNIPKTELYYYPKQEKKYSIGKMF